MRSTARRRRLPRYLWNPPEAGAFPYDRLGVLVALVLLGAAFSLTVPAPAQYLVLALLLIVFAIGEDFLLRSHARYRFSPALLVLPAVHLYGVVLVLPVAGGGTTTGVIGVAGLAILGLLLAADVLAERLILTPGPPGTLARTALEVLAYAGLFVLYAAVFQSKARTLMLAPIVLSATFGVAYRVLQADLAERRRAAADALVVALGVAEALWALTYWPIGGLAGGAALLVLCYALLGLLRHMETGSLKGRTALQYAAVGALSLMLIFGRTVLASR